MRTALCSALGLALIFCVSTAQATVRVAIDLSRQRMHVEADEGSYNWPISSARSGFSTPEGSYAPTHLELMHYSRKYHMSPMPHAIFFRGGYAIHGTYATGSLGRPASHGCVRLSPGNAAALYTMVKTEGARISISGSPPANRAVYGRDERRSPYRRTDAFALSRLAPPSSRATADQTYGDAVYARRRVERRAPQSPYYGYGEAQGYGAAPYYGYRAGYAYAPAYLSAPQIYGGAPRRQIPLVPFYGE